MKNLPTYEQYLNELNQIQLWRNTSWKWLYDLLHNRSITAQKDRFISFSLDQESGGQDNFGKTRIELDYHMIINQGGIEIVYEPEFFEEYPDISKYVTGYKNMDDYYEDKGYEGPKDANADGELTWDQYITDYEPEQEVVLKKIKYQQNLIKMVEFFEKTDDKLIDLLNRYKIPYKLNESTEEKIYDLDYVQKEQNIGFMSSDIIFNSKSTDQFILTDVLVKSLKINGKPVPTLSYYRKKGLDEDISIVIKLIKKYQNYEKINPIVISENGDIMDGIHRVVAYKELKLKTVMAYKRISN